MYNISSSTFKGDESALKYCGTKTSCHITPEHQCICTIFFLVNNNRTSLIMAKNLVFKFIST